MNDNDASTDEFIFMYAWEVEGARVGAMLCARCGATVMLHPKFDTMKRHSDWHRLSAATTFLGMGV